MKEDDNNIAKRYGKPISESDIEKNKIYTIYNLINKLNEIKILKHLKLKLGIEIPQLLTFNNKKNIEYFNIDFILPSNKLIQSQLDEIYKYFNSFINLKEIYIEKRDLNNWNLFSNKFIFKMVLPPNLKTISISNINGKLSEKSIIHIFKENLLQLKDIEEININNYIFENEDDFKTIIDLMANFNSLLILSLDNVKIDTLNKQKYLSFFYENISYILKKIPSLKILNINNSSNNEEFFKNEEFTNIELSIPNTIFSLKIFGIEISPNTHPIKHC